jgi:hypothetical protein
LLSICNSEKRLVSEKETMLRGGSVDGQEFNALCNKGSFGYYFKVDNELSLRKIPSDR